MGLNRAEELAKALGVGAQSIYTYKRLGLTYPAEGESIEAWVARARTWIAQNRKRKGPPTPRAPRAKELDDAELRKKRAEAALKELELEERRGQLHSVPQCEELQVRRYREMVDAFGSMGDALARRLHLQPPDLIKVIVDEEVRRRLESVAARASADVDAWSRRHAPAS